MTAPFRLTYSGLKLSYVQSEVSRFEGEWWNGIHEGLKIPRGKPLVGSNPTSPISSLLESYLRRDPLARCNALDELFNSWHDRIPTVP